MTVLYKKYEGMNVENILDAWVWNEWFIIEHVKAIVCL